MTIKPDTVTIKLTSEEDPAGVIVEMSPATAAELRDKLNALLDELEADL